jgi:hypothetical protein
LLADYLFFLALPDRHSFTVTEVMQELFETQDFATKRLNELLKQPISLCRKSTWTIQRYFQSSSHGIFIDVVQFEENSSKYVVRQRSSTSPFDPNDDVVDVVKTDALTIELEWIHRFRPDLFVELLFSKSVHQISRMRHSKQAELLVDSLRRLKIPFDEVLNPLEMVFQSWMRLKPIELTVPTFDNLNIGNIGELIRYVDENDDDFLETLSDCLNRLQNEKCDALDLSRGNLRTVDELAQVHQFVLNHREIVFLDLSNNFFTHDCLDSIQKLLTIGTLQIVSISRNPMVSYEYRALFSDLVHRSPQLLMKLIWISEFLLDTGFWNSVFEPTYAGHRQLLYSIREQHRRFFDMLAKRLQHYS